MAVQLLSHEVSDLCLGKPPLRPLPVSSTVSDALSLLRRASGDPSLTVWSSSDEFVGKISIVDVLCFLCREDNVSRPSIALHSPISLLLQKSPPHHHLVKQLEPNSSLLEAVDCILDGAQNLIVPKRSRKFSNVKEKLLQKSSIGRQFCWISHEDVIRFFLNSISHFSAIASNSIQSLNIVEDEILAVHYNDPALSALSAINSFPTGHTAVAVLDDEGRLFGEISLHTLAGCDETLAPAVATLSAGDLMGYIDYGGPSEDLVQLVKERLEERKLDGMLELLDKDHSNSSSLSPSRSSSSDDEVGSRKSLRRRASSGGFVRGTEPIVCHPGSSLVAVMIQALSNRLNYVWVIEQDYSLVGMVTFAGMLKVFRDRVPSFP